MWVDVCTTYNSLILNNLSQFYGYKFRKAFQENENKDVSSKHEIMVQGDTHPYSDPLLSEYIGTLCNLWKQRDQNILENP